VLRISISLMALPFKLNSVMSPLLSNRNFRLPLHLSFSVCATRASSSPSILSSIIMSAPASMASFASDSDCTSTSKRRLNPPTVRACSIATVIDSKCKFIIRHDHARKVMAVAIDPSNQHSVLFDESKAWRRLPCAGNDTVESVASRKVLNFFGSAADVRQVYLVQTMTTHLVAIPLHLARRLRAIRSPMSKCLAFPLTVATCLTGSNKSPSFRDVRRTRSRVGKDLSNERHPLRRNLHNQRRAYPLQARSGQWTSRQGVVYIRKN